MSTSSYGPSAPASDPESDQDRNVSRVDGGHRAWLVVLGGFLDFATAFGIMNSFGTFQAYYTTTELASDTSKISWIGSSQLFLLFLGGIFVGPAVDRWGSRRLMVPGAALCIISHICTSFATRYYQLLLSQGFLFGIRNAMLYYPATSSTSEWFDKKRALALGIAISGSSVGGIFWPLVVGKLLDSVGFAWSNRILALISLPLLAASCFLVKERKVRRCYDVGGHRIRNGRSEFKHDLKGVVEKNFLILCAALFFIFGGMLVPFYWIPLYALEYGFSPTMSNAILAIGYAGSVVGRIASGWAADRMGRFNILACLSIMTSVLIFCWTEMTSFAGQVVFSILFGFSSGGLIPLGAACVAQTTADLSRIGLRIGAMMAICSTGTLTGGPISGVLRDGKHGWAEVHCFAGATVLLGVVFLILARISWESRLRARF